MGVYRFRDLQQTKINKTSTPSSKRYVICNPTDDFILMPTDLIYVLQQFDPNCRKGYEAYTKIPDVKMKNSNSMYNMSKDSEIANTESETFNHGASYHRSSKLRKSVSSNNANCNNNQIFSNPSYATKSASVETSF